MSWHPTTNKFEIQTQIWLKFYTVLSRHISLVWCNDRNYGSKNIDFIDKNTHFCRPMSSIKFFVDSIKLKLIYST